MAKNIYLIHGWGGSPQSDWLPWAKQELEKQGYTVVAPEMPETDAPEIAAWVNHLARTIGTLEPGTILIGHSIGCQAIMRYLEQVPEEKGVKIIFVAPWLTLSGLDEEEEAIAAPWFETPINFTKVRQAASEIIALFSDNDPCVPLENVRFFEDKLAARTTVFEKRGHFDDSSGAKELPELLSYVS